MKRNELEKLLDDETAASERSRDEGPSDRATRRGGTRSVVYSVRLTPEETSTIQRIADDAGIPASALVREWVLRGLGAETGATTIDRLMKALSRDVDQLRRRLNRREAS